MNNEAICIVIEKSGSAKTRINKRITNMKPKPTFCSSARRKFSYFIANEKGSSLERIFEPSRGGTGTRLKNAKNIFKTIYVLERLTKVILRDRTSENLTIKPNTIAIKTLAAGPAAATIASPHFWLVKL